MKSPDNKVYGANMGPTWVLAAPDGRYVASMKLAIRGGGSILMFVTCIDCDTTWCSYRSQFVCFL